MSPIDKLTAALAARGCRGRGSSWTCPAHDDRRPSLSVREGADGRLLLKCHRGCSLEEILAALGLVERDLFPDGEREDHRREVATYDYTDEDGNLLFQVVRYHPKAFRQRRPDGRGGWIWNLDGVRRVLYRLPKVVRANRASETIYVVEGEKDVHALEAAGAVATTNPGGAGKWRSEYSEVLRGAHVVVVADRDDAGRRHAHEVARSVGSVAASVRVVEPTKGKDASDHLAAGGTLEELVPLPEQPSERLLSAAQLLAESDEDDADYVVEGLLVRGGTSVLAARPKCGKSTFSRALALAVAQGKAFLGRAVHRGPVLLISLEDRRRDVARHLRRLGLRAEDPLFVATAAEGLEEVQSWVREHRPSLVIIDTVARLLKLRDISDYAQVTAALDGVLRLARASGAHIMLLHHAPKGSDGRDAVDAPLGSIAIGGTVDVAFHMKRAPDGSRTLAAIARVGEDLPESVVVLDEAGWPVLAGTRRDLLRREAEGDILEFLSERDPATRAEILEAVGGRTEAVLSALGELVAAGLVLREGSGRRGDPYLYSVPPPNGEQGTETLRGAVSAGQRPSVSVPTPGEQGGTAGKAGTSGTAGTGNAHAPSVSVPVPTPTSGTAGTETGVPPVSAGQGPSDSVPESESPSGTAGTETLVHPDDLEGEEREALERVIRELGAVPVEEG
jgi:putative DNA primase/helicase